MNFASPRRPTMADADLLALAGRVEGLSGPSEEMDALIKCAIFAPGDAYVAMSPINGAWCVYRGEYKGRPQLFEKWPNNAIRQSRPTASIDAAMALSDSTWGCQIRYYPELARKCWAEIYLHEMAEPGDGHFKSAAATLPLALAAAAIRARHSLNQSKESGE